MIVYPALDLLSGQVVRLEKGDFSKVTEFKKSPFEWFDTFESLGARAIHLVDLSGAKNPDQRQTPFIKTLIENRSFEIQVGGGIRSLKDIESLFEGGVRRIVLGSVLFSNSELVIEAARKWGPDHFTLAFDVLKKNQTFEIMTHGWTSSSGQELLTTVKKWHSYGFSRILCTDISRDGMMSGPNLDLYQKIQAAFPALEIQASGGVSNLQDLYDLKKLDIHSVVIGRSFLSGQISLQEALSLC